VSSIATFVKGWWHVLSALLVTIWLVFGWVAGVNEAMAAVTVLEETTVRKDVLNETMKRIEVQLELLNEKFDRHYSQDQGE
jgi:hypothetical protein